jgi:mono/diheme cytochrome c family protein
MSRNIANRRTLRGASPTILTILFLAAVPLAVGLAWPPPADSEPVAGHEPAPSWSTVTIELPSSQTIFPPGDGADIANAQCLICHSAGMVLRQPALTEDQWVSEINKMRNSFGALLPADQVAHLARYLHGISGAGGSEDSAAPVDGQGS